MAALGAKAEPALSVVKYHYVKTQSVYSLTAIIDIKPEYTAAIRDVFLPVTTPSGDSTRTYTSDGGVPRPDGVTLLGRVRFNDTKKVAVLIAALPDGSSAIRLQAINIADVTPRVSAAPALPNSSDGNLIVSKVSVTRSDGRLS